MSDAWGTFKASSDYVELDALFEQILTEHIKAAADEANSPGVVDIERRDEDSVYLTLQLDKAIYEKLSHAIAWYANDGDSSSAEDVVEFTETIVDALGDHWFGDD